MRKIELGECCADCFAAINYNTSDMPYDHRQRAQEAGKKLSNLLEAEHAQSVCTGDYRGFGSCTCAGCRNEQAGDRWHLVALQEERRDIL